LTEEALALAANVAIAQQPQTKWNPPGFQPDRAAIAP
jgi:hypothetical protein